MTAQKVTNQASRYFYFVLLFACAANAQERSSPPNVVVRQCSGCHGVNGDSQRSYVPRLAGIDAAYLESKLQMYRSVPSHSPDEALAILLRRNRADDRVPAVAVSEMTGIARSLSEDELKSGAEWYAAQSPLAHKPKTELSSNDGRNVFTQGTPDKKVPPCQSCHGPEGQGTDVAPRIAGQHSAYILAQLDQFRKHGQPESPMTAIARSLPRSEAEAVAKYLETH